MNFNIKKCDQYRILIVDFGSQYTQLLLRRVRELGVYSELCDWNIVKTQIFKCNPNGIILSGGPYSTEEYNFPFLPECVFQLGIPILGICYGMQIMAVQLGGYVQHNVVKREFGNTQVEILLKSALLYNLYDYISNEGKFMLDVWMSHGDKVIDIPKDFVIVGATNNCPVAVMANEKHRLYGLQFHPEVTHTKQGRKILERFVIDICGCRSHWRSVNIIDDIVSDIKFKVGDNDRVVLAFSGGIDSLVVALLLKRAIGDRFWCIFIDNGLLNIHGFDYIYNFYIKKFDIKVICISEEQRFLNALIGIIDPEEKRKIIGSIFIEVFEEQISNLNGIKWLAQGTIYSDVIESGISYSRNIIKSHHNVGGLPRIVHLKLLEPLRNLFKDEVRDIGLNLGLSSDIVYQYPFPGPGLAIRILGEVKQEYCNILRKTDFIFLEELKRENLFNKLSQAFTVFLPIHSVGIQGDRRQYTWVIALRAIETIDFMTARWAYLSCDFLNQVSNRIVNEVDGVSRVVYDISSKPPATIEWE